MEVQAIEDAAQTERESLLALARKYLPPPQDVLIVAGLIDGPLPAYEPDTPVTLKQSAMNAGQEAVEAREPEHVAVA